MRGTRTTPNDCGGCGQKIPLGKSGGLLDERDEISYDGKKE
jgi:hypothetical protein